MVCAFIVTFARSKAPELLPVIVPLVPAVKINPALVEVELVILLLIAIEPLVAPPFDASSVRLLPVVHAIGDDTVMLPVPTAVLVVTIVTLPAVTPVPFNSLSIVVFKMLEVEAPADGVQV